MVSATSAARLALASVVEHFDERSGRGRFTGLVGDVIDADAVAGRQVPRVRGSVRVVAVMEESAHAARICNRDDDGNPSMNRSHVLVECAVSSDRDDTRCGAFWNVRVAPDRTRGLV